MVRGCGVITWLWDCDHVYFVVAIVVIQLRLWLSTYGRTWQFATVCK